MKIYSKQYLVVTFLSVVLSTSFLSTPSYGMKEEMDVSRFTSFGPATERNPEKDARFFFPAFLRKELPDEVIAQLSPSGSSTGEKHWDEEEMENRFWTDFELLKTDFPNLNFQQLAAVAHKNQKEGTKDQCTALAWEVEQKLQTRILNIIKDIKNGFTNIAEKYIIQDDTSMIILEYKQILTKTSEGSHKTVLGIGLHLSELEKQDAIAKDAFFFENLPSFKAMGNIMLALRSRANLSSVRGKLENYIAYCDSLTREDVAALIPMMLKIYTSRENLFFKFINLSLAGDYPQRFAKLIKALEYAIEECPQKLAPDAYKDYAVSRVLAFPEDGSLEEKIMYVQEDGKNFTFKARNPNDQSNILTKTLYATGDQSPSDLDIMKEASRQNSIVHRGGLMTPFELFMMAYKKKFCLPSFISTSTNRDKAYFKVGDKDKCEKFKAEMKDAVIQIQRGENITLNMPFHQNTMFEFNITDYERTALLQGVSKYDEDENLFSPYCWYEWKGILPKLFGKEWRLVVMLDQIEPPQSGERPRLVESWCTSKVSQPQRSRLVNPDDLASNLKLLCESYIRNHVREPEKFLIPEDIPETNQSTPFVDAENVPQGHPFLQIIEACAYFKAIKNKDNPTPTEIERAKFDTDLQVFDYANKLRSAGSLSAKEIRKYDKILEREMEQFQTYDFGKHRFSFNSCENFGDLRLYLRDIHKGIPVLVYYKDSSISQTNESITLSVSDDITFGIPHDVFERVVKSIKTHERLHHGLKYWQTPKYNHLIDENIKKCEGKKDELLAKMWRKMDSRDLNKTDVDDFCSKSLSDSDKETVIRYCILHGMPKI